MNYTNYLLHDDIIPIADNAKKVESKKVPLLYLSLEQRSGSYSRPQQGQERAIEGSLFWFHTSKIYMRTEARTASPFDYSSPFLNGLSAGAPQVAG